jgi:hypothetical protein
MMHDMRTHVCCDYCSSNSVHDLVLCTASITDVLMFLLALARGNVRNGGGNECGAQMAYDGGGGDIGGVGDGGGVMAAATVATGGGGGYCCDCGGGGGDDCGAAA